MHLSETLEKERKKLLQLDGNNPLLNFRPYKKGIESNVPDPASLIFHLLDSAEVVFHTEMDESPTRRPNATFLHDPTVLIWNGERKTLSNRLTKLSKEAKGYIEEQGVNILYIGIGILRWKDIATTSLVWRAPLVLIPVEIEKTNRNDHEGNETFTITYNEDQIEPNHSLIEALKELHHIQLPSPPQWENLDSEGEVAAAWDKWIAAIAQLIHGKPDWEIEDAAVLGFFSFTKYLMYKDLESSKWCKDTNPEGPELLSKIISEGFGNDPVYFDEDTNLDEEVEADQPTSILDMDSSQAKVVLEVQRGKSLVVQGPPGTGKSQTIANLLADALNRGLKVLFVAEKRAALDVVKRRLEKANLGKACLELHGAKAKKTEFTKELSKTLNIPTRAHLPTGYNLNQLRESVKVLRQWSDAVNAPLDNGYTPYDLMGSLLIIDKAFPETTNPLKAFYHQEEGVFTQYVRTLSAQSVGTLESPGDETRKIIQLQSYLSKLGFSKEHPLWGVELDQIPLTNDLTVLKEKAQHLIHVIEALVLCFQDAQVFTGLPLKPTLDNFDKVYHALNLACEVPDLLHSDRILQPWLDYETSLSQVINRGTEVQALQKGLLAVITETGLQADVTSARQQLASTKDTFFNRLLKSEFSKARKSIIGLLKDPRSASQHSLLELADRILHYQSRFKEWQKIEEVGKRFFESTWSGLNSDWAVLENILQWAINCNRQVRTGILSREFLQFVSQGHTKSELLSRKEKVAAHKKQASAAIDAFKQALAIDQTRIAQWRESDLELLKETVQSMKGMFHDLGTWVQFRNHCRALRGSNKALMVLIAEDWEKAPDHLTHQYLRMVWTQMFREARSIRPILHSQDGTSLEQLRQKFTGLDKKLKEYYQAELINKHNSVVRDFGTSGQPGNLRQIAQKSRRIPPIRKVLKENFDALVTLKPIFMMSPLSVASYLEPVAGMFDLVVFDEASQIEPVDAFGAIMRGKQLVVVGDTKQMPPTNFFKRLNDADESVEEESTATEGQESIMDVMLSKTSRWKDLQWHYRSRHHTLIELSNKRFYDEKLLVFPSSKPTSRHLGVNFTLLDHMTCPYEGNGINSGEATAVAEAVCAYVMENPTKSVGVVTFNIKQRDLVEREIQLLARKDSDFAAIINNTECNEPFFIKNLESVQGDERDAIFISVGYGMTEGNLYHNFGPINREGGERRLNVLITRAREMNHVFSNFSHADMRVTNESPNGVKVLKDFLCHADTGEVQTIEHTGRLADSPFEVDVADELRRLNYDVEHQVGCKGYRIDLAVCHPDHPGVFVMGVECDGATYHRSRSARDRDRLRQAILEDLGWNVYRIWSTDWFTNKASEVRRLHTALQLAVRNTNVSSPHSSTKETADADVESAPALEEAPLIITEEPAPVQDKGFKTYQVVSTQGWRYYKDFLSAPDVRRHILETIEAEYPIHIEHVLKRAVEFQGTSLGSRIRSTLVGYVDDLTGAKRIQRRGDFLWKIGANIEEPRNFDQQPKKDIEMVAPEELALALCKVAKESFTLSKEDLVAETAKRLGFRAIDKVKSVLIKMFTKLVKEGKLQITPDKMVKSV